MTIQERYVAAREAAGLSIPEAGKRIAEARIAPAWIPTAFLHQIETCPAEDYSRFSEPGMRKLAEVYGVRYEWLDTGEGDMREQA